MFDLFVDGKRLGTVPADWTRKAKLESLRGISFRETTSNTNGGGMHVDCNSCKHSSKCSDMPNRHRDSFFAAGHEAPLSQCHYYEPCYERGVDGVLVCQSPRAPRSRMAQKQNHHQSSRVEDAAGPSGI